MHVKGTVANPIKVPSHLDDRIVGCACEGHSEQINWINLKVGFFLVLLVVLPSSFPARSFSGVYPGPCIFSSLFSRDLYISLFLATLLFRGWGGSRRGYCGPGLPLN